MLCYEKGLDFCHRYLVAFWLGETLNIKVKVGKDGNLIKLERPEYLKAIFLDELKYKIHP